MTTALTRSYEKTVQLWVGHRTAAVSIKQVSVAARQTIPARRAEHDEATWAVAGSSGAWDHKIRYKRVYPVDED